MSTQSFVSQRKTNTFVTIPFTVSGGDLVTNVYLVSKQDFEAFKRNNASKMTITGNVITVSINDYTDVISDYWFGDYYNFPDQGQIAPGVTLTDLGNDVYIGVPGEPNILHLRLVQAPTSVANLGKGGIVGYTPIECNSDLFDGNNYPNVGIARVQ
jgi:hypothetical protein